MKGSKKGGKIIRSVVNALIEPGIQYLFSWTGKSKAGETKLPFNVYKEIVSIIHSTCRCADPYYSIKECEYDLTYKIFKHANTKR